MTVRNCLTCILILALICILSSMAILIFTRVQSKRKQVKVNEPDGSESESEDISENVVLSRFQESAATVNQRRALRNSTKFINKRQQILNSKKSNYLNLNTTILVIRVHHNISYLRIFRESISKVSNICESLLIFAHDFYDDEINSAIRNIRFTKFMEIFYPYSIQLYPNVYPGEDLRFCERLTQCIDSKMRDPALVQTKLFWWWIISQVFDNITALNYYDGYIYFLDTQQYLTRDFIHMAKQLERLQPSFCPDCKILSLGSRLPRPNMYYPENSNLILSAWGWSNYSSLGFGFNRTTWEEIKALRKHFCIFQDTNWEYSLRYLASKTTQEQFFMLSTEGPRFFPTAGCGAFRNEPDCDLVSNYHDILKFLPKIDHGRLSRLFKLKLDVLPKPKLVEPRGGWGDARDIQLCMLFASKPRAVKSDLVILDMMHESNALGLL